MEDKEKIFMNENTEEKKDCTSAPDAETMGARLGLSPEDICWFKSELMRYDSLKTTRATNPILDAYYRGEKVRRIEIWGSHRYVCLSDQSFNMINQDGELVDNAQEVLYEINLSPKDWELYTDPVRTYSGAREVMQALRDEKRLICKGEDRTWIIWYDASDNAYMWNNDGKFQFPMQYVNIGTWTEVSND